MTKTGHATNNIAGTYTLVLVDNLLADGSRIHLYGENPHGILMLDSNGNYSLQIVSEGRPHFKAGDKSKGTDEENRLAIQRSNAHFGTYTIDTGKHAYHHVFNNPCLLPELGGNQTGKTLCAQWQFLLNIQYLHPQQAGLLPAKLNGSELR